MKCASCNFDNSNTAKFCQDCGTKLIAQCPSCDHLLSGKPNFCENCGHKLTANTVNLSENKQPSTTTKSYAERRQLTVLFCDMKGSTALSEKLDAEQFREVILSYHNIAEEVIVQHNGHVAQYLGDGLMVYFGYPYGLEDAPQAAARSALGILQAMAPASNRWKTELDIDIAIRIGIHTGLVVVDDHLGLGDTCNITARLEGLANENSAVISQQTQKLIADWFELQPLGQKQIKGLSYPMEVFELKKEFPTSYRLALQKSKDQKPLIGRKKEIDFVIEKWQQTKTGEGQIIVVKGDAGFGKSRLIDDAYKEIKAGRDNESIQIFCSSYHKNTPLHPISQYIKKDLMKIESDDTDQAQLQKLSVFYKNSSITDDLTQSILADLLSIPFDSKAPAEQHTPNQRKEKTFEVVLALFLNAATQNTLLVRIEDVQYADSMTTEWLGLFAKEISNHPICVLITTRTQLKLRWLKSPHVHQVNLGRIPESNIQSLCLQLTNGKMLPKKLIAQIKDKTDGIPLYIIELTRMLLESDAVLEEEDRYILKDSKKDIQIPTTLQDLLMSRLDRLAHLKDLFQKCSVFGRTFSFEMLHEILGISDEELYRNLSDLVNEDVLIHNGTGSLSNYVIKQALFRDLAYDSLLNSRKRKLHGSIADAYIKMFGEKSSAYSEIIAYHLQQAHRNKQAATQWYKTGLFALQKFASKEALMPFKNVRMLLSKLPSTVENTELLINCQMQTVGATIIAHGFVHPDVERYSLDCLKLKDEHPTISHTSGVLHFLGWHYNFSGRYSTALTYHTNNLELVRDSQVEHLISDAQINLGCTNYLMGRYQQSEEILDTAIASLRDENPSIFEDYGFGKPIVSALYHILHVKFFRGSFEGTEELLKRAFSIRDKSNNPWVSCMLSMWEVEYSYKVLQDHEASLATCSKWAAFANEHKQAFWAGYFSYMLQLNKSMLGDKAGIDVAHFIFNQFADVGAMSYRLSMGCDLVKACLHHKKLSLAESILQGIKTHAESNGEGYCLPDLHRMTAHLNLAMERHDQFESEMVKAINIAQEQGDKLYELRSAIDLAEYYITTDRQSEIYTMLEPIHSQFDSTIVLPDYEKSANLLKLHCKSVAGLG